MIGLDELPHFTQDQVIYMMSRLRSESKTSSFMLATCNPDGDSWLVDWVLPYLDDKGYPKDSMCGKILYYVLDKGKPQFAETEAEIREKFPDLCQYYDSSSDSYKEVPVKTFTFLGGTIMDNPALIRANPGYLADLKQQTEVQRARLLEGCWFVREENASYFSRDWLNKIEYKNIPTNMKYIRAWDKASSIPTEKYRYPDYTTSIKMGKDSNGNIYIFGDYDMDAHDEDTDVIGRFRRLPGDRDRMIEIQSQVDGEDIIVVLPKDPSSAGVIEFQESAKKLISKGFIVKPDAMPGNKKKVQKFSPFSSACQNGFVYIVEDSFPNKATLEHFYRELEIFNGERSTATIKDD